MYKLCIVLPYLHVLIESLNLPIYYRHWLYLQKTLAYWNKYKELMLIASESPKGFCVRRWQHQRIQIKHAKKDANYCNSRTSWYKIALCERHIKKRKNRYCLCVGLGSSIAKTNLLSSIFSFNVCSSNHLRLHVNDVVCVMILHHTRYILRIL